MPAAAAATTTAAKLSFCTSVLAGVGGGAGGGGGGDDAVARSISSGANVFAPNSLGRHFLPVDQAKMENGFAGWWSGAETRRSRM